MTHERSTDGHWNDEREHAFLRGIGTYSSLTVSRTRLLQGYLAGAYRRAHWGHMNSERCIAYCEKLIAEEALK